MPNPYHDETGRFCSGDEMRGAVERLRDAGKISEALDLSIELADIERDRRREQQNKSPQQSEKAHEEFAKATKALPYSEMTTKQLASKWLERRGEDIDVWEKGEILGSQGLSPELRADIISTLDFSDRYDLIDDADEQFSKETVLALLADQEQESYGKLTANSLYWGAMHRLPAAESAVYATRSPGLAKNYYDVHGWLKDNSDFDRLLLENAGEANDQLLYSRVAKHTGSPEVLTSMLQVQGIHSAALIAAAKNPALTDDLVLPLVNRAGNRLGSYQQVRQNLLANESLSKEVRLALYSAPRSLSPKQRGTNLTMANAALAEAGSNLHDANVQERNSRTGEQVSTHEFYRRARAVTEAKLNFEQAVIAKQSLPKEYAKFISKPGSKFERDKQVVKIQNYLQYQSDLLALQAQVIS